MNSLWKAIIKGAAIALCLIANCQLEAVCSQTEKNRSTTKQAEKPSYLFVMHAQQIHIAPDPSNPTEGVLTLEDVDPDVVFFSDRPDRRGGKMLTTEFLDNWTDQGAFEKDAPNAAIVSSYSDNERSFTDYPVILSDPSYRMKNGKKSISFKIKELNSSTKLMKYDGNGAFLFVDSAASIGWSIA